MRALDARGKSEIAHLIVRDAARRVCREAGRREATLSRETREPMIFLVPYLIDGNNLIFALREVGPEVDRLGLCELLDRLAARGERVCVIFDGPPCLLVSDGPVASTMVDGVVLVVRAGANTYGVVQRARDMLSRVGAHILGVVLNGVRVTSGGYLRKNYETFYEYHEQAQLPAK